MSNTIFTVADYFLYLSSLETENSITPLKLQKLCYYAQAWNMVWDDETLFDEDFEAWAHGPVNPQLYDKYKKYKWSNIPVGDIESLCNSISTLNSDEKETLDVIWADYGKYDGKYLEDLTHEEDPWVNARGDLSAGARSNTIIEKEVMKEYYTNI